VQVACVCVRCRSACVRLTEGAPHARTHTHTHTGTMRTGGCCCRHLAGDCAS
jgi:hypothetical protein